MTFTLDDTIAAIATAPGGALRGAIRVSGPDAVETVAKLLAGKEQEEPLRAIKSATAMPATLRVSDDLPALPTDLLVWPTSRSYTQEPMVEIHTIGSPPLVDALLQSLCAAGARLARPGEFTLRAFLAGRLDMTQAEAVLGVIDAQDRRDFDVALSQLGGGLADPVAELRSQLLDLLADLEAGLDFVDEDITFLESEELENKLRDYSHEVARLMRKMELRGVLDGEPRVVLVGPPNAGKSSLFNALVGDSAAIVSPQAGTTRDYVTRRLDLDGIRCLLIDTAGKEESETGIAGAAQEQSREQAARAELQIVCADSGDLLGDRAGVSQIVVRTKCDVAAPPAFASASRDEILATSAATGHGIDALRAAIRTKLLAQQSASAEVVPTTAARCGTSLRGAAEALERALHLAENDLAHELIAAELRLALTELGLVAGVVHTDDLLDRIFSRFCIGK